MTIESVQFSCFVGLGCISGSFYGYGVSYYWLPTRFTDVTENLLRVCPKIGRWMLYVRNLPAIHVQIQIPTST